MAHRYELEKYRKYGAGTNVLPVTVNGCLSGISIPQQTGIYSLTWDGIADTFISPKSISTPTRRKKNSKATSRVKADIICRTTQRSPKG